MVEVFSKVTTGISCRSGCEDGLGCRNGRFNKVAYLSCLGRRLMVG